jgi:hypothetical protein
MVKILMPQHTLLNNPAVRDWWGAYDNSFETSEDGPWLSLLNKSGIDWTFYSYKGRCYTESDYFKLPGVKRKMLLEAIRNLK